MTNVMCIIYNVHALGRQALPCALGQLGPPGAAGPRGQAGDPDPAGSPVRAGPQGELDVPPQSRRTPTAKVGASIALHPPKFYAAAMFLEQLVRCPAAAQALSVFLVFKNHVQAAISSRGNRLSTLPE